MCAFVVPLGASLGGALGGELPPWIPIKVSFNMVKVNETSFLMYSIRGRWVLHNIRARETVLQRLDGAGAKKVDCTASSSACEGSIDTDQ